MQVAKIRIWVNLIPADSSSLLNTDHSPLCSFQAVVDTASEERAASVLSDAVSTSIWEPRSSECRQLARVNLNLQEWILQEWVHGPWAWERSLSPDASAVAALSNL